jgi:hypothetical protein
LTPRSITVNARCEDKGTKEGLKGSVKKGGMEGLKKRKEGLHCRRKEGLKV